MTRLINGSAPKTSASNAANAKPTRNPLRRSDRTPKKHKISPTASTTTPEGTVVAALEPALDAGNPPISPILASPIGPSAPVDRGGGEELHRCHPRARRSLTVTTACSTSDAVPSPISGDSERGGCDDNVDITSGITARPRVITARPRVRFAIRPPPRLSESVIAAKVFIACGRGAPRGHGSGRIRPGRAVGSAKLILCALPISCCSAICSTLPYRSPEVWSHGSSRSTPRAMSLSQ